MPIMGSVDVNLGCTLLAFVALCMRFLDSMVGWNSIPLNIPFLVLY